jgi:hypothetical protein
MVIVLAIVPKVRGFSPGHDDGLLKAIKTRSTTSFGVEIKPSIPCRKKLRQGKKKTCGVGKRYFVGKIHGHFSTSFSLLRY